MRLVFPCINRMQHLQYLRAFLMMLEMSLPLMMMLPRDMFLMIVFTMLMMP